MVVPSMRMYVMRIKISSVDKSTVNRMSISSSIVFEWRLSKVSGKRTIRYPPCGLFKLSYMIEYLFYKLLLIFLAYFLVIKFIFLQTLTITFLCYIFMLGLISLLFLYLCFFSLFKSLAAWNLVQMLISC
jgi:hypothetical protein